MATYTEQRHLRYSPEQVFDLIADLERYPDFVPWLNAARILRRHENTLWVEMAIGTGLLQTRFTSKAVLDRPTRIEIGSEDPLFDRFHQTWSLQPGADTGTLLTYRIDFRFRSRLLQTLMSASFGKAAGMLIAAFERRARRLYGHGARTSGPGRSSNAV